MQNQHKHLLQAKDFSSRMKYTISSDHFQQHFAICSSFSLKNTDQTGCAPRLHVSRYPSLPSPTNQSNQISATTFQRIHGRERERYSVYLEGRASPRYTKLHLKYSEKERGGRNQRGGDEAPRSFGFSHSLLDHPPIEGYDEPDSPYFILPTLLIISVVLKLHMRW